ncbi:adenylosuccinate synthetase [Draconibacterium halophilum]|uniref:Adenylosuccinate synthetase n=1 Tax=Draconibacterium halophilum TaxID=2706887 RepID=A0A6C0RDT8_9BACT|nr:adenylosuccinate synthetase [Draconibacterium halophilum]QIA08500.1 adenylosuccinate synthetase [Draconibacterium halophilum]
MIKKASIFTFLLFVVTLAIAQAPSGIPTGKAEPLEMNLPNIIFFIVLPILLLIFYIIWRRKRRK